MDGSRVLTMESSWRVVFSDEMPRSEASSRPRTMVDALEALSRLRAGNRRFATNQTAAPVPLESRSFGTDLGSGAFRDHSWLLGLQGARGAGLRSGVRRPVRHPGCREHRRALAGRQRRVCSLALRHAARRRDGPYAVRCHHGDARRTSATIDQSIREPAGDCRSRSARPSWTLLSSRSPTEIPTCSCAKPFAPTSRASVEHLRHGSELLERLIAETGLLVVGAEYSLETGVVDFFENVPDAG